MPSDLHEIVLDLLRADPTRIVDVLRDATGADVVTGVDPAGATIVDPTVPRLVAPAHACDLVIELPGGGRADDRSRGAAVIVEVQLRRRRHKELSWPLYWSAVRMRVHGGAVCLVVITTRASVERWATATLTRVIPVAGRWLVIGPTTMARVVDAAAARRHPEAALLSALIHAGRDDADLAPAIAEACSTLPIDRGMLIQDLLASRLSRQALDALEVIMQKSGYVWKSDFARRHRSDGLRDGLLAVIESRGLVLSDAQLATIRACTDPELFQRWLRRAATATGADAILETEPSH